MSDNILYNYKKKTNVTFSIFKDLLLTIFCIIRYNYNKLTYMFYGSKPIEYM